MTMPKTAAQMTGILVTAIIAFGTDMDVFYSVPLGIFAGALRIFFVAIGEARLAGARR
jgi:hypothetical protein